MDKISDLKKIIVETLDLNKAQDIKESAGVTVLQNEWTLGIAPQVIEKNVGVIVSQGSTTGLLKTALKGETTSVVISVAHDVTFVSGVEIKIDIDQVDGGCVVVGTVNTATKTLTSGILKTGLTGLTTSVVIQTISNDVLFVSNVDVVIGTTIVANNNSNGIRAKNFYQCLVCKVGKFSSGQNANECNNCTKGKYQNENSKSNCLSCIPGRYEDRNGIATECKSCKKDYYAEDVGRKISCEKCQKGRNTNGKDSSTKCSNCPAGQFVNNITQACEACPAGYSQKKAEKLSSFIVMRFATARVMYSLFFMFIAAKKTSRICIAPSLFRIVSRGGGCVPISVQPTAVASRPIQTAAAASFAASFYITTHLVKGVFRSPHQLSRL